MQLVIAAAAALLSACVKTTMPKTSISKGKTIKMMQATDLHYLSPALCDNGVQFQATMDAGDGKMTEYSEVIIDQLVKECIDQKPDIMILSGDITFNGEKISLQEVADKLKKVEDAGIPIVVIPGNHDIEYPFAYQYIDENVKPVEEITTVDFEQIMADYGWNQAVSNAPDSMSYLYPVSDDLVLMMLDANTKDAPGNITKKTLSWMKKELEWAEENGIRVIAVSHQNILKQNSLLYKGFIIENADTVYSLLHDYNVTLALSGHSHLQHISEQDGFTDICTESIAVYPLQYGMITIGQDRSEFTYENKSLHILENESLQRFNNNTERQIKNQLEEIGLVPEKTVQNEMISFGQKMNRLYFTGHISEAGDYKQEKAWKYWNKYAPDSFFFSYLESMGE